MSQTVSATTAAAAPVVSRRLAQFGVALIAVILVACFAILIVARANGQAAVETAAPLVAQ